MVSVAVAVIAAIVVAAGVLLVGGVGRSAAHGRVRGLPNALASERLFFAEADRTGLYQADGVRLRTFPSLAGTGYVAPLVSGDGQVFYIHDGRAYRTSGTGAATPVNLGSVQVHAAASNLIPTPNGGIGIELAPIEGPATIRLLNADGGHATTPLTRPLPPGAHVAAEVPSGLLIETPGSFSDPIVAISSLRLSLFGPQRDVFLGLASAVIGVHGDAVAWTSCPAPRSPNCALHVMDTSSGEARIIPSPARYNGFAQIGGGFSPNGRMLAAFVPSRLPGGAVELHLVVEDLATRAVSVVEPAIPSDVLSGGVATWSADGHWLYFGGVTGRLHAREIGPSGPRGHSWALPLPTSVAVVGD
ncbi:MAG TPA: hypothetical protein VKV06_14845 [Acidimicrobiales bacterium]|nr:hypothetical protein [Acidimicrobiales bacterium]